MASGAPDWQKVFTLVPPSMTHGAPDWERTAVGPGGAPLSGLTPIGTAEGNLYNIPPNSSATTISVTCSNTEPGYAVLGFIQAVAYSITVAANEGVAVTLLGDVTPYVGSPQVGLADQPGVIVTDRGWTATWCGLVYLTIADAVVYLETVTSPNCTAVVDTRDEFPLGVWA